MRPGDVPVTYADTSALERDFGYKPSTSLQAGRGTSLSGTLSFINKKLGDREMREFKDLKIAVAGTGYVGLSIATLVISAPQGDCCGYHPKES